MNVPRELRENVAQIVDSYTGSQLAKVNGKDDKLEFQKQVLDRLEAEGNLVRSDPEQVANANRCIRRELSNRSRSREQAILGPVAALTANTGLPYFAGTMPVAIGETAARAIFLKEGPKRGVVSSVFQLGVITPQLGRLNGLPEKDLTQQAWLNQATAVAGTVSIPDFLGFADLPHGLEEKLSTAGLAGLPTSELFGLRATQRSIYAYALKDDGSWIGGSIFFATAALAVFRPQLEVYDSAAHETLTNDMCSGGSRNPLEGNVCPEGEGGGTTGFDATLYGVANLNSSILNATNRLSLAGGGLNVVKKTGSPLLGAGVAAGSGLLMTGLRFLTYPSYDKLTDAQKENLPRENYNEKRNQEAGRNAVSSLFAGGDVFFNFSSGDVNPAMVRWSAVFEPLDAGVIGASEQIGTIHDYVPSGKVALIADLAAEGLSGLGGVGNGYTSVGAFVDSDTNWGQRGYILGRQALYQGKLIYGAIESNNPVHPIVVDSTIIAGGLYALGSERYGWNLPVFDTLLGANVELPKLNIRNAGLAFGASPDGTGYGFAFSGQLGRTAKAPEEMDN